VVRRFDSKVVVVTGGGGGLGRRPSLAFAEEGAAVALVDNDVTAASEAAEAVREHGGRAVAVEADVADFESARAAVASVESQFGGVDVLVNAAGGSLRRRTRLEDADPWEYELVVSVNLNGTFYMSKAVASGMAERGRGAIVNVSSMAGRSSGHVAGAAYGAAKAGVIGMTRHTARELGPHGIRVNAVAPGFFPSGERVQILRDTTPKVEWDAMMHRIALGRLPDTDEVVRPIMFLASEDASFITGVVLDVNGGAYMG
jgi:NAD(P)-dependent dehydrogenase (short-subunit alcohol dehydrogenase family)